MRAPDRILDRSFDSLLDLAADESPEFGGGAAACVSLAAAAGLVGMCARRSRPSWPPAAAAAGQADVLRTRASDLVEESAAAYAEAAARLPGREQSSDAATPTREWKLGVALARAADAPLRVAELSADVAELALEVANGADPGFRAEAVAACLLAEATARIGAHLVEINLTTLQGDERLERATAAAARATRSRELLPAPAD